MFLVHCPTTDTARLRTIEAIRDNANTPVGIVTVVGCRCGGEAVLVDGVQRAHHAPGAADLDPAPARTAA